MNIKDFYFKCFLLNFLKEPFKNLYYGFQKNIILMIQKKKKSWAANRLISDNYIHYIQIEMLLYFDQIIAA